MAKSADKKTTEATLNVKEARKTEVGRGIVRIDPEVFDAMDLVSGDAVLIEGDKKTVGLAWKGSDEDEGRATIHLDPILRHNAGVGIDDEVRISKIECKDASQVVLAPSQEIEFEEDFVAYVADRIMNMPLLQGNSIVIEVMGTAILLTVAQVKPKGVVRIVEDTELSISKKPIKVAEAVSGVSYESIGGLRDEIESVREMIETPLRHPEVFKKLGIKPPKGVLLYGPPGCGKTLLAKAVANETEAHFTALNGPEIMSKYYGQSEENLRSVFEEAQKNAPAIIFIDEIDSIAPSREEVSGEVEKRIVSQLLTLMDGLEARGDVVVIAATNRPEAVDSALRRPGRFDREIEISVPDREGRKEILQIHTRGMPIAEDVNLDNIANTTHGFVGADLSALSREAAMSSLKRILPKIDLEEKEIPAHILEELTVRKEDFTEALKGVGPSALREVMVEVPNVRWTDIGGLDEVKKQLTETVEWSLKYPELFKDAGIEPPKGVLLYGPSGCGKTLLAKAVATESKANFITVRGPEIMSKWVGESEKGVRKIFRRARQVAPAVVFFDEVDSVAATRGMDAGSQVTERVVAQLLTEIDGVSGLKNVTVMGSTNRPDLIDPALMRPGRLDKLIYVPFPDAEARKQILQVNTRKMNLTGDVKLDELVKKTEDYTGADLAALCREAGMNAIRESVADSEKGKKDSGKSQAKTKAVSMKHVEDALRQVKGSITKEERERWERIKKEIGQRG